MTPEDARGLRETFLELDAAVAFARDAVTRGHTLDAATNISAVLLTTLRLFAILARLDPQQARTLKSISEAVFEKAGV